MRVLKLTSRSAAICFALAILMAAVSHVTIKEFDVPTPKSRPMIPQLRLTDRFGTPDRRQTNSDGLILPQANSKNFLSKLQDRVRTA